MATDDSSLYLQVVRVTDVYLGPAADRFISRQVQNHLHKEPVEVTDSDLLKLIDWVRVAFSMITEDTSLVEEYISRLQALAINANDTPAPQQHAAEPI